ncbi:hypothetical protein CCHR01_09663 [Colletotrichum chrysophilum]|uniref:Uncharacterized protein n=1 Tax=Colletotrichum chrysophilum TaxID=1836956 RepID=A0AAD9EGI3_9PEZI|nr:hypothetical protein CCHR01_09663 [Colletotrichum chrysophilum]
MGSYVGEMQNSTDSLELWHYAYSSIYEDCPAWAASLLTNAFHGRRLGGLDYVWKAARFVGEGGRVRENCHPSSIRFQGWWL